MKLWKSLLLVLAAACLQILIFPNFGFWFLAWVMIVPLLAVFDSRGVLSSFLLGALFGLIMALGITYWLYYSVVHYFEAPAPLGLSLVVAACLFYAALYTGLFGALVSLCRPLVRGPAGVLMVPCLWVACEVLRASWLSENAWGLLGYSQHLCLPLIQVADLTGVYGISFIVVMVNTALYRLVKRWAQRGSTAAGEPRGFRAWGPDVLAPLIIICAVLGYGQMRLQRFGPGLPDGPVIRTVSIQGNINRKFRWKSIYYGKNLTKYMKMSRRPETLDADLLVWPENALNFHPDRDATFLGMIRKSLSQPSRTLVTGAPHMETGPGDQKRFYNASYLITAEGIQGVYRKIHLMPFSERKPWWVRELFGAPGEAPSHFVPGSEHTVFALPGASFSSPVCFEMVYPELIRGFVAAGAQFLVNISNDSWFGPSAGPHQHLIFSTIRAVENRRFVIRAANTGISAVIAPTGKILRRTGLNEEAVLAGNVVPLSGKTFYTRWGDVFAAACALTALLAAGFCLLEPLLSSPRYFTRRFR